jgi:hypothetical protein
LVPGIAGGIDVSADTDEQFAPRLRLSGLYIASRRDTADGTARFQWLAARLALSPLRFQRGFFTLRPALELDAGSFQGRGEDTRNARTQALLWLAAGPALHLEGELGRIVSLEAQVAARALARNDQFVFKPDTEAFDMPRVSFGAVLGLVARLP